MFYFIQNKLGIYLKLQIKEMFNLDFYKIFNDTTYLIIN